MAVVLQRGFKAPCRRLSKPQGSSVRIGREVGPPPVDARKQGSLHRLGAFLELVTGRSIVEERLSSRRGPARGHRASANAELARAGAGPRLPAQETAPRGGQCHQERAGRKRLSATPLPPLTAAAFVHRNAVAGRASWRQPVTPASWRRCSSGWTRRSRRARPSAGSRRPPTVSGALRLPTCFRRGSLCAFSPSRCRSCPCSRLQSSSWPPAMRTRCAARPRC